MPEGFGLIALYDKADYNCYKSGVYVVCQNCKLGHYKNTRKKEDRTI